jgi:hypothetical protein
MKPLARRDGLVVRDLADETLVYDRERHQAHCLNRTAASVFRLCDGERSAEEIAASLEEPADPRAREALVAAALGQLSEARLLADVGGAPLAPVPAAPAEAVDVPRRELLRRVGTALLVPAIASIVAPTPAQAASNCILYSECGLANYQKRCYVTDPSECTSIDRTCCGEGDGECDFIFCP